MRMAELKKVPLAVAEVSSLKIGGGALCYLYCLDIRLSDRRLASELDAESNLLKIAPCCKKVHNLTGFTAMHTDRIMRKRYAVPFQ